MAPLFGKQIINGVGTEGAARGKRNHAFLLLFLFAFTISKLSSISTNNTKIGPLGVENDFYIL